MDISDRCAPKFDLERLETGQGICPEPPFFAVPRLHDHEELQENKLAADDNEDDDDMNYRDNSAIAVLLAARNKNCEESKQEPMNVGDHDDPAGHNPDRNSLVDTQKSHFEGAFDREYREYMELRITQIVGAVEEYKSLGSSQKEHGETDIESAFWNSAFARRKFPIHVALYRQFPCPATSCAVERVFSQCKLLDNASGSNSNWTLLSTQVLQLFRERNQLLEEIVEEEVESQFNPWPASIQQ
jgi:hypothetical protein